MHSNQFIGFLSLTIVVSLASCEEEPVSGTPEFAAGTFRSTQSDGLELHWTFENRTGTTILDMSGNGRDGTLTGGSFVSAPWGDAVTLDGVDDKISFTGPRDPLLFGGAENGSFTVSAHVRVDDVDRYNTLCVGCAPLANLTIGSTNIGPRVAATLHDPTLPYPYKTFPSSHQSLSDNTWTHVTMVVQAGVGTTFYLNCAENRFISNTNVELHDFGYSSVGEGGSSTTWYDGEIDDLKVWSRALSAEDVKDLCPCGGAPEAYALGIAFPRPPSSYTPPAANTPNPPDPVTTVAWVYPSELETAVDAGYEQIVLRNGTYTAANISGDYLTITGQKLWAESLGGVTLEFAVYAGGDSTDHVGSELHGLVFDIDDTSNAFYFPDDIDPQPDEPGRAAISAWDQAEGLVVEDCVIRGDALDTGIYVTAPEDFVARRLEINGLERFGVLIGDDNDDFLADPMILEDIRIWDIDDPNEVVGVAMKLGEKANVSRVHVRDASRNGIVLFDESYESTVSYVDVDRVGTTQPPGGVGVYFDGTTELATVDHFCVGPDVRIGVNSEWDHNAHPYGINNTVEYGLIEALWTGVYFDQGTVSGDVNHVTFRNYSRAAIAFYNNASSVTSWPTYNNNSSTQSDNTFEETQVNCSVCDVTYSTWSQAPQCAGQPPC